MAKRRKPAAPKNPSPIQSQNPLPQTIAGQTELFSEVGVAGLKESRGFVIEEFHPALSGHKAIKVYREMADNDAIIGAIMFSITNMLRSAKWTAEPSDSSDAAKKEAEFVESLFDDMSHTWGDFIAEVLTMLIYGWQFSEIVLKRRVGPDEVDPEKRSKFDDGRIGIRKLAPRSQDTMLRWEMQPDGGVAGIWQVPWITSPGKPSQIYIPIERGLLFRTTSRKNNPEGLSVLRTAYRSWYYATRIEEYEAIGVERELAGLPVIFIPSRYFRANASPEEKTILESYKTIARDVRRNEQGGLVVPSDPWFDPEGKPISLPQVKVELLSSGGARAINIDAAVLRHQTNIARSVLADFVMLGNQGRGSYALSKSKTDLFLRACETFLNIIAEVINRHLLPRIWQYNNIDHELMPEYKPGRIAPVDLAELGAFLRDFAAAGGELFPDETLENYVRDEAGLPEKSQDAIAAQQYQQAHDQLQQFSRTHNALNPPLNPNQQGATGPGGTKDSAPPAAMVPGKIPTPPLVVASGQGNSGGGGRSGGGGAGGGNIGKFNPNHDEQGRFSSAEEASYSAAPEETSPYLQPQPDEHPNPLSGAPGPVAQASHAAMQWLKQPSTHKMLLHAAAATAVTLAFDVPLGYGMHEVASAVLNTVGASGAVTNAAAMTGLYKIATATGLTFPHAKALAIGAIDHMLGVAKAATPPTREDVPPEARALLLALRGAFERCNEPSVGKGADANDPFEKFDPNQPRDYHGRWSDSGAIAAQFVSPNQDPANAHSVETAYQQMGGARQKALRDAWHTVDNEFGHHAMTSDALGAWSDGAENSSVAVIKGADWQDLKASAAMKGFLGNQKSVLAFQQGSGGDKSQFLASFHATGSLTDMHKSLLAHGLEYHTLSPSGNGAAVWIYGSDQKTLDAAAKAAAANGGKLSVRYGHGEFIGTHLPETAGDSAQRADARKAYQAAISDAPRSRRDYGGIWDRVRNRYGQGSLDALKIAKAEDPVGLVENPKGIEYKCGTCDYFKDGKCGNDDPRLNGRSVQKDWCCNKYEHDGMRTIVKLYDPNEARDG